MRRRATILAAALLLAAIPIAAVEWPQWRGPALNGTSAETGLPLRWSKTENVAWKLALPEDSASTPIVWRDRVFLNVAEGSDVFLWCVDRTAGTLRWKRKVGGGNRRERKHNMSSPSPATDGQHVWVMTGTGILKAFDMEGLEIWSRDLAADYGALGMQYGYGASPLLFGDSLYVPVLQGWDTDDPSYVLRISGASGRTIWRVERPTNARGESPDAYTTPAIVHTAAGIEIVVTGGDVVTGHHPDDGRELWRAGGLNPDGSGSQRLVASPVVIGDTIIVPSRERPLLAFRAGGRGDVTRSHTVWTFMNGPDVPTPVTDGEFLYIVNDRGIMWCLEVKTGREVYGRKRIRPATYSGSPVLADGRLYVTDEDGVTSVVRTGPTFELLAENDLDGYTLSSPAISDGQIFIRTSAYLYAIGQRR